MERPYIFCHMLTSLDGKIMGNFFETPEGAKAGDVFYKLAFGDNPYFTMDGWICGRVTTDDNFTFYKEPLLDESAPLVPAGDFVVPKNEPLYYISIDTSGRLGWESSTVVYETTRAQVIEVLTGKASNAYKAFLRAKNIPYIIAGETELDYALAMDKLCKLFGIKRLMLGGGGIVNWSFMQAGLCDEVSVVIAASADGSMKTPTLFAAPEGLATDAPKRFELIDVSAQDGGAIWARYKVINH